MKKKRTCRKLLIILIALLSSVVFLIINFATGLVFLRPWKSPPLQMWPQTIEQDALNKRFKRATGIDIVSFLADRGVEFREDGWLSFSQHSSILVGAVAPKNASWRFDITAKKGESPISITIHLRGNGEQLVTFNRPIYPEPTEPPDGEDAPAVAYVLNKDSKNRIYITANGIGMQEFCEQLSKDLLAAI